MIGNKINKLSGKPKFLAIFVLVVVIGAVVLHRINENIHFSSLIPPEIETVGRDFVEQKFDLFDACGIAVWKLSPDTKKKIQNDKITFLNTARSAYKGSLFQEKEKIDYEHWVQTSSESAILSDGLPASFSCTTNKPQWDMNLLDSLKSGEAFYTRNGNLMLIAVPKMKIIVISFIE